MSSPDGAWVYDRRNNVDVLSKRMYTLAVSAFTLLGIGISLVASAISRHWKIGTTRDLLLLVISTFVVAVIGCIIAKYCDSPALSLTGYALVAFPLGLMSGPVIAAYTPGSVIKVLVVTTAVVVVFGIIGIMIPQSLEGFGSWVLGALLVLIMGYCLVPLAHLFGAETATALTALDWVGVVVFCGIVVFDWNRAMHEPRTLDNAIDSALNVYLDWFNLFVRFLSLIGDLTGNADI